MLKKKTKLKDIAEAAGVDISTVSLCLNDSPKVSDQTKAKIRQFAESMNYFPNITAKALRGGKSKTIGIGLPTLNQPFFNQMLKSMVLSFYKNKYYPLVFIVRNADCKNIFNNIFQRNIDGLCLGNAVFYKVFIEIYKDFINSGKPLAFYIEKDMLPLMDGVHANFAVCDLAEGNRKIFKHLFDLNHKRIAIIGPVEKRYHDYCEVLNENGIEVDHELVIRKWGHFLDDEALEGKILTMLRIPDPPTAIYVNSDKLSVRVMKILLKNGIRIPEDVSLISINDTPMSDMLRVPLTTLRIPVNAIGEAMAEMVLKQIDDPGSEPQRQYMDTELIVRDSTAAI